MQINQVISKFGMIILDEVHTYTTGKYGNIFFNGVPILIGLTATADERLDGFDKALNYHLGHIINAEKLEGYQQNLVSFTGEVIGV